MSIRIFIMGLLAFVANMVCADAPIELGSVAPNWVLADTNGKPVSLYQHTEVGDTTVMIFFASWCNNCKALYPMLKALQAQTQNQPVVYYLLNVWEDVDATALKAEHQSNIPLLLGADNVARRFNITNTPGIVVVGPDRRVIYKRPADATLLQTQEALSQILRQTTTTPITP